MPNNKGAANGGFRYVELPEGNSKAIAFYTAEISKTAYYTAGAWVNLTTDGGVFGVRSAATGEILGSVELKATEGYAFVSVSGVALEKGTTAEVFVQGAENCGTILADDFQLLRTDGEDMPTFANLHSFKVENAYNMVMDPDQHTISFHVPLVLTSLD